MIGNKLLVLIALCGILRAADLAVVVTGAAAGKGEIGCALYASAEGFPMDSRKAVSSVWVPAAETAECRFPNLTAGTYAVAVSLDLNGNRRTDKNFLGIPTEPWGVSNNVRPTMRAPKFTEARFAVGAGEERIGIRVAK